MAKTILNSILHEREHYCVSVRPIALLLEQSDCNNAFGQTRAHAIMLERVQCGVQHGFSHVINLLLLLRYTIK